MLASLASALAAADSVHGVPAAAPPVAVTVMDLGRAYGAYRSSAAGGPELLIDPAAALPGLVMAHEVAHYILAELLGLAAEEAVQRSPVLAGWRIAVGSSDAFRGLAKQQRRVQAALAGHASVGYATTTLLAILASSTYDLRESELFARGYAQLLATQGGSRNLARQLEAALARSRQGQVSLRPQWEKTDFVPVGDALEALLRQQGWRW